MSAIKSVQMKTPEGMHSNTDAPLLTKMSVLVVKSQAPL